MLGLLSTSPSRRYYTSWVEETEVAASLFTNLDETSHQSQDAFDAEKNYYESWSFNEDDEMNANAAQCVSGIVLLCLACVMAHLIPWLGRNRHCQ